jgi:hypothetical protein
VHCTRSLLTDCKHGEIDASQRGPSKSAVERRLLPAVAAFPRDSQAGARRLIAAQAKVLAENEESLRREAAREIDDAAAD